MRSREEIKQQLEDEIDKATSEEHLIAAYVLIFLSVLLDIRDAKISSPLWGIYCPQHVGSWYSDTRGKPLDFPTKQVAEAFLERVNLYTNQHLWEVCEFGKQRYIDPDKEPTGTVLCPRRTPSTLTFEN